ncbi:MAG: hypothetical protein U1E22_01200, partial [Coriobacteriia bacterium]|nr:hypothetical protein [Coriobacteriia bacterium]
WGLPKKASYTTSEILRVLDMGWQRFRYAIDSGRLPDCGSRDAHGHRMWTEAEVERAIALLGMIAPPGTNKEQTATQDHLITTQEART